MSSINLRFSIFIQAVLTAFRLRDIISKVIQRISKIGMDFSELFRSFFAIHSARVYGDFYRENISLVFLQKGSIKMKKITVSSELIYILAVILLSLAVAILTSANFGISMIVAPAYLLSLKIGVITFGQAEYIVQAGVFVALCVVLKGFKPIYLMSFFTCLIYGAVLDLWRRLPFFDPSVTAPGSMSLYLRIPMFIIGVLLTAFSVALFFKTYFYPQVYDFFVKTVSRKCGIKLPVFKTAFDLSCLTVGVVMSFCFFGKLTAISWGKLLMALLNGSLIGFFSRMLDRVFEFRPCFEKFAVYFETCKKKSPA